MASNTSRKTAAAKPAAKDTPAVTDVTTTVEETAVETVETAGETSTDAIEEAPVSGAAPLTIPAQSPAAAVIDAPPASAEEQEESAGVSADLVDAAAERLRVNEQQITLTDARGNKLDPDALFSEADAFGRRRALVRILQHGTATIYDRGISTLVVAVGADVSETAAQEILTAVKAANAAACCGASEGCSNCPIKPA